VAARRRDPQRPPIADGEQRELHAVGRLDARVAVAPRRRHGRRDRAGAGGDERLRGRLAVFDLEREADGARDAAARLDLVHLRRLRLVEQLDRRASGGEEDDAAVIAAPVGELLETERIAVERERLVEVGDGQRDAQLRDVAHARIVALRRL
jgi:hypothetical protein